MTTKSNTKVQEEPTGRDETTVQVDPAVTLYTTVQAKSNLSQKIRYLAGHYGQVEPKVPSVMGAITKYLKDNNILTGKGTPVRFQHVRNTLLQPVKKTS